MYQQVFHSTVLTVSRTLIILYSCTLSAVTSCVIMPKPYRGRYMWSLTLEAVCHTSHVPGVFCFCFFVVFFTCDCTYMVRCVGTVSGGVQIQTTLRFTAAPREGKNNAAGFSSSRMHQRTCTCWPFAIVCDNLCEKTEGAIIIIAELQQCTLALIIPPSKACVTY